MGLAFVFALDSGSDQDDNPVLRDLVFPMKEELASCYEKLLQFLTMIQPPTFETMPIKTEDQDIDRTDQLLATQDNASPSPIDSPKHPITYPDTELAFELDPELDVDIDFESDDELDFDNMSTYDPDSDSEDDSDSDFEDIEGM